MKIETLCAGAHLHKKLTGRPLVTISYAQSIDGSITTRRGVPLSLSGRESLRLWHRLRVCHDAVLVGIGTVLADDPQLNVRLVTGTDPQPVILDAKLRFPLRALALKSSKPPWIITTRRLNSKKQERLESRGAQVISLKKTPDGWIDLAYMLKYLAQRGIESVMVEGGARVITSFIKARLADYFVITITPFFVGGLHVIEKLMPGAKQSKNINLDKARIIGNKRYGRDLVIWGTIE
ncbi:MAG: RibD family protein [candidate division WOR-3 bacterium]|nr:MAG: RibD family protein [candidate division WOR-3 bacterium]